MKTITLTRPAPYQCEGVTLLPGDNTVPDRDVSRLVRNKLVRRDIDAGILIMGHGKTSEQVMAVEEMLAEKASSAAESATLPDDMKSLRELAEGDGRRKDVQEARAKLAELEGESDE